MAMAPLNLRAAAVGVALAVVAAGCGLMPGDPTLADHLVTLRDSGARLGRLIVRSDGFAPFAFVVRDGVTQRVTLEPDASEPEEISLPVAATPWSVAGPHEIASQVDQLSAECPDSYDVEVEAATATALISTVSCDSTESGSSKALLNGKPFPAMSGKWTAKDWQALLDEWATLAPSGTIGHADISDKKITTYLAPAEKTHDCAPHISQSSDGSDVSFYCLSVSIYDRPANFVGLTGEDIAAATALAMLDANMSGLDVQFSVDPSVYGYIVVDIRSGGRSASAVVKPTPTSKPTLTSRLTEVRNSGASLASVHVEANSATAVVVREGRTEAISLLPLLSEPKREYERAMVTDWSVISPATVAARVEDLAKTCPDSYSVSVTAAAAAAYIATVACSGQKRPSKAYLNDKPFQPISDKWDSADWKHLLDEWAAFAPSRTLGSVDFRETDFRVWFGPSNQDTCRAPFLQRSVDGLAVSFHCDAGSTGAAFSFDKLTPEKLAAAVSKARNEAKAPGARITSLYLESDKGKLLLTVGINGELYKQILNA